MTIAKELGYKRYFQVQELVFKIIGIDVTKKTMKHPLILIIPSFAIAMMLFLVGWKHRHDADKLTESLAGAGQVLISSLKVTFLLVNQNKILNLVESMWTLSKADDLEERAIISDLNTKAYYFSNSLAIGGCISMFLSLLTPHVVTIVIYLKTGEVVFFSPIQADIYIPGLWKYTLLHTFITISTFISSVGIFAIDSLYIWLVLNVMAQFRIVNLRFKRAATMKNITDMNCAVSECIRFHQRIIELTVNFDEAYQPILFVQFAMSSLPLCFVGFQLTVGSGNMMYYFSFFVTITFQIGLYCYLGQQIQDESYNVAANIYDIFSWEKLSKASIRILLIAMSRAQKCCDMTGIFFVVDVSLFEWVCRTTTSYITILWTLAANAKE